MTERIDVGSEGMTRVKYVGGNIGSNTQFGRFTGARYVAGGNKQFILVDDRDLRGDFKSPGILELLDNDQHKFELAPLEEVVIEEPVAEDTVESYESLMNRLTVYEVKQLRFDDETAVEDAVRAEMKGKNRITVIEYLEDLLEE